MRSPRRQGPVPPQGPAQLRLGRGLDRHQLPEELRGGHGRGGVPGQRDLSPGVHGTGLLNLLLKHYLTKHVVSGGAH